MNAHLYPHISTAGLVHNLASGDAKARVLLNLLTSGELRILHKNRDLLERIVAIAELNGVGLWRELEAHFDLEITVAGQGQGDFWVDLSEERARSLPDEFEEWYKSTGHTGWYLCAQNEFNEWAREFLLQEVRTNLTIRYIEHKRAEKKKVTRQVVDVADAVAAGYGLYL